MASEEVKNAEEENTEKKEEEEKNNNEPSKCYKCKKKCQIRHLECDQSGLIFHCACFTCSVCGALLNELNVRIRRKSRKLFCSSHAIFEDGFQPVCKIYGVLGKIRVTF